MDARIRDLATRAESGDHVALTELRHHLRRHAGGDGRGLRLRQGDGPVQDADALVAAIRTDRDVSLVEPAAIALHWSAELARRWACDCVEHVMPAAGDEDVDPILGAIETARQYAAGVIDAGILDSIFTELFVEEWPSYDGPYFQLVKAVRQATARDVGEHSPAGSGIVVAGEWAATAAAEARAASDDPQAERTWQVSRLLDYLLLDPPDAPAG